LLNNKYQFIADGEYHMDVYTLLIPIGGIVALLFATFIYFNVKKQSPGNEKMQELSNAIREGAMAF